MSNMQGWSLTRQESLKIKVPLTEGGRDFSALGIVTRRWYEEEADLMRWDQWMSGWHGGIMKGHTDLIGVAGINTR